jgi:hypothetical protein
MSSQISNVFLKKQNIKLIRRSIINVILNHHPGADGGDKLIEDGLFSKQVSVNEEGPDEQIT